MTSLPVTSLNHTPSGDGTKTTPLPMTSLSHTPSGDVTSDESLPANISDFETTCPQSDDPYPFRDFAPTLAQCYLLVVIGYLVAKLQLLSAADIRGVSAFVGYIGMPGIICMTLADADFGDLRWELVLALFLGKCFVFVLVAGVSLTINGNVGIAGLLAVFCVHTNDLPVGNPLMSSIYKEYRPHMMKYLFLMPAMTMIFFVPVGTFMLEIHKVRRQQEKNSVIFKWKHISKKEVLSIFRSLLKSGPVIFASVLGTILNFTFKNKLPAAIHQPFQVIAATVPGCVISILGFNMVRKERYLITSSVITAAVLLAVKMFITPIVMHTITRLLTDESESSKILSDFALLYGIISPATAIFLSGQEFRKPLAGMSAALILASFLCFPSSYVVGRFTIAPICQLDDYIPLLKKVLFWIASFSVACNLFVAISIFYKGKWKTVPYCYILCLVLTQILTSSGIILWNILKDQQWMVYSQMVLYNGGEISEYFYVGIIAAILTTVNSLPAVFHNRVPVICLIILVLFGVFTSVLCLVPYSDGKEVYIVGTSHSKFEYMQLVTFTVIQALTILVVTVCLLIHSQRKHSAMFASTKLKIRQGFDNPIFYMDTEEITATHYKKKRRMSILSVLNEKEEADQYYEEVLHNGGQREKISSIRQNWTFRLFSLLVLLLITISLKFVSNLYKLFLSNALEIMIPLEFLQSSLFVGQGFFILLTFGIDTRTLSIGIIRWWRKIRYGKEEFLPSSLERDEESDESIFCNQFRSFYLKSCFQSLAKDRKWKENSYKNCFWGHQLVDWMIQESVAKDDVEAEELGQKLVVGGVISHVTGAHHFHDAAYLYFFVREEKTVPNCYEP